MKHIKPYFYDRFKCKADKCTDSCCIGWEIDIDEETVKIYNSVPGSFGVKLKNNIGHDEECSFFITDENARCPFLDKNGLCEIYTRLGADSLCDICREHPRFYNDMSDRTEYGLGLCCEKVCELLFCDDQPLKFDIYDDGEGVCHDKNESELLKIRGGMFDILSDDTKSFSEKINSLFNGVSSALTVDEIFCRVLNIFAETEPIDDDWERFLSNLTVNIENLISVSNELEPNNTDYSKLITYILYRHFVECSRKTDTFSALGFAVLNIVFIYMCDCMTYFDGGKITAVDRINTVKRWSKQIEYSDKNVDLLLDEVSKFRFCKL